MPARLTRALRAALLATAVATPLRGQDSYDVIVQRNVMVPMRDGVRLATDLYLPARDGAIAPGRFPAILARTPYGKSTEAPRLGDSVYARRGYAVVYQDVRGRFGSEGVWSLLTNDGPDGRDACLWIAQQPWSDGSVGMMGISYVGGTQHALAMEGCPNLKTVIPIDAMSNYGYQSIRNGGAFELRFFNWPFYGAANGSRQARDPGTKAVLDTMYQSTRLYAQRLPIRPGATPLAIASEYEAWLVEAMRQPGGNNPFWRQNDIVDHADRYQDIPVYLVGGWYDSWGGNTSTNYRILSRRLTSPVYLIFGPWVHGQQAQSAHGQVAFGPEAAIPDTREWQLQWFDRWLKGRRDVVGQRDPFRSRVRIFVMGTGDGHKDEKGRLFHGGAWRDESDWPLARARPTDFFLQPGGGLSVRAPAAVRSSTTYQYDPRNPVPTIGGNISFGQGLMQQGGWDQRGGPAHWNWTDPIPLAARQDVLVFQSEPLAEDVEVTGEITVTLWISSDSKDTDFTAKLIDLYPSSADFPGGFALNLEDGIIRARFRKSLVRETPLVPGAIEPVEIKLYPTSNVFKRGHRIRVDVSSSNFPRFDPNPNTGEPLGDARLSRVATNTIHHDASRRSRITLPIVPIGGRTPSLP